VDVLVQGVRRRGDADASDGTDKFAVPAVTLWFESIARGTLALGTTLLSNISSKTIDMLVFSEARTNFSFQLPCSIINVYKSTIQIL
jgi:hypothetical protein